MPARYKSISFVCMQVHLFTKFIVNYPKLNIIFGIVLNFDIVRCQLNLVSPSALNNLESLYAFSKYKVYVSHTEVPVCLQ